MSKLLNKLGLYTKKQLEKIIYDTEKRVVKEQEKAFLDESTMIINGDCNTVRDITLKDGRKLVVTSTNKTI